MVVLYVKLAFATAVVLAPGWLVARALGVRSVSATPAWSLVVVFGALALTFALGSTLTLTLRACSPIVALAACDRSGHARVASGCDRPTPRVGVLLGRDRRGASLDRGAVRSGRRSVPPRPGAEAPRARRALARAGLRVRRRQPPSRVRLPALARLRRVDREGLGRGP